MTDMVERVKKALRKKCAEIEHRPGVRNADLMWFDDEYARAAIAAMWSPTARMLAQGATKRHSLERWQSMIDAALQEDKP